MGTSISSCYHHARRIILRYNVQGRTEKLLNKGALPVAPRHPLKNDKQKILREREYSREDFEDLYIKNPQLNEYLKKVYLTSTTEGEVVESKRQLPQKRGRDFYQTVLEPEKASPGHCTLLNVYEMMVNYRTDPERWNINVLAKQHNMDKKDIIGLLTYYSLFKKETFRSMNAEPEQDSKAQEKVEFEVFTPLVKKPKREQIEGGKN